MSILASARKLLAAVPLAIYLWSGGIVAVGAGLTTFIIHERNVGARAERLKAEAVIHKAAVAHADSMVVLARIATQEAIDSVRTAMALVEKGKALEAKTRDAARAAGDARARAEAILADSMASLVQLRGTVSELVGVGRRDSTAAAQQHAADTASITALTGSVRAYAIAITQSGAAQSALTQRALSAERQVGLLKKGDGFSSLVKGALLFTAGVGAGYLLYR